MQYGRRLFDSGSRFFNVALATALAAATLAVSSSAGAQAFPFPSSNVQPGNGRFITPVLTSHEIRAAYDRWRTNLIRPCPGRGSRVIYPETNGDTRSEGIGYGMVIAAYMGDQTTFDGLWAFYESHSNNGLMNWLINNCDAVGDTGSASDADIDAAFGLIVADKQWGGYAGDASGILAQIRGRLFNPGCGGILLAGSNFSNCGCVNPSYIPPGYYAAFSEYDNAGFWNGALAATYAYLAAAQNDQTGLVPAWSNSTGGTNLNNCNPQVAGGGQTSEFQADAARTPWRVATDLLWHQEARASAFLAPMARFATSPPVRITHVVDRYQLGGAPLPGENGGNNPLDPTTLNALGRRSTFTMGGFATAMTASTQQNLDQFTGAWQSLYAPGDSSGTYRAFGNSLALLYGLLVTGSMWDPAGPNPVRVQPPVVNPEPGNLLKNGDFDEGLLGWTVENYGATGAAQGYAMHRQGELNILIQGVDIADNIALYETIGVQANQNYLMRFRARAAAARRIRLLVQQEGGTYTVYGNLANGAEVTLGTEFATYEWVFKAGVTDPQARFKFQFGDSAAAVTLDDVVFQATDLPVSEPDAPVSPGGEPTVPVDPSNPGTPPPGSTPSGSTPSGSTPPGGSNIGTVTPGGEPTGSGLTPVGAPDPNESTGGLPPGPAGRPTGNGQCTVVDDPACGMYECSTVLGLCYENTYGYVWDAAAKNGAGDWSQPPNNVAGCGPDFVFWPKVNGCYDPETGYAFDPVALQWVYRGDWYTAGQDDGGSAADSGCVLSNGSAGLNSSRWLLIALFSAALGLVYRRRVT